MPLRDSRPVRIPPTDWYRSLAAAGLRAPGVLDAFGYWLGLEGSLTRALQLQCRESFGVDILREGFARPTLEEARTLGIPLRQLAWVREVCLSGDETPWVLARTVIPMTTLTGRNRRLRSLGRSPLGAYLFSNPRWQRGPFETGVCRARGDNQPVAARRSRFYSGTRGLLVGEYFLPALIS